MMKKIISNKTIHFYDIDILQNIQHNTPIFNAIQHPQGGDIIPLLEIIFSQH